MRILKKDMRKEFFLPVLGLLALTALSCNNLTDMTEESKNAGSGAADGGSTSSLKISLGEKDARTALPSLTAENFTKFTLYGKNITENESEWRQLPDTSMTWTSFTALKSASVAITKEKWAFRLDAEASGLKYSDDATYASGIDITEDVTSLSFTLRQTGIGTLSGTGSVSMSVSYPAADVGKVTVTVQKSDGTAAVAETEISSSGGTATYTNDSLAAGQYKLIFKFYKTYDSANPSGNVLLGLHTERALVVNGAQSSPATAVQIAGFDEVKSVKYVTDYIVETEGVTINESETVYYSRQSMITTLKSDAEKANHGFDGWYRESNCNEDGFSGTAVTAYDITNFANEETLYAKWVYGFTVTFNANGGSGSMASQLFIPGVASSLPANTFTRSNYLFVGWSTTSTGEKQYDDQTNYTANAPAQLYAVWTPLNISASNVGDIVVTEDSATRFVPKGYYNKYTGIYTSNGWVAVGRVYDTTNKFMLGLITETNKTFAEALTFESNYSAAGAYTTGWKLPQADSNPNNATGIKNLISSGLYWAPNNANRRNEAEYSLTWNMNLNQWEEKRKTEKANVCVMRKYN